MAPIIGYWNIRGLVEPILLTMEHVNAPYKIKNYIAGGPPDFDESDWYNVKETLGLIHPNIPYYIDGDFKMTQTLAILRYLARKYDLGPKDENETVLSDVIEQGTYEIIQTASRTWYSDSDELFESNKAVLLPYLEKKMVNISECLGSNKFMLGDRVTYIDFLTYSTLDYIRLFKPSLMDGHERLKNYLERIEALPNINKYLKSEGYSRFPITATVARWGNDRNTTSY